MAEFEKLFARYDKLVILDTETTGLRWDQDEIIEFAAVTVVRKDGKAVVEERYDELIALSPQKILPPKITELTGISMADLRERGFPKPGPAGILLPCFPGKRP